MAKVGVKGDNRRNGSVKKRTQFKNKKTGLWTKRDAKSGKFLDVKTVGGKFKGVRREKKTASG